MNTNETAVVRTMQKSVVLVERIRISRQTEPRDLSAALQDFLRPDYCPRVSCLEKISSSIDMEATPRIDNAIVVRFHDYDSMVTVDPKFLGR